MADATRPNALAPTCRPDLLRVQYQEDTIVVSRSSTYEEVLECARRVFQGLHDVSANSLYLSSDAVPEQTGIETRTQWRQISRYIGSVTVCVNDTAQRNVSNATITNATAPTASVISQDGSPVELSTVCVRSIKMKTQLHCQISPKAPIHDVLNVKTLLGFGKGDKPKITFQKRVILENEILSSLGAVDNPVFILQPTIQARKPIIYIHSPVPMENITVTLTLSGRWSLSAVYPLHPSMMRTATGYGKKVSWIVSAEPDGTLTDKATGAQVAYLYWEAEADMSGPASMPLSPPASRSPSPAAQESRFDPAHPMVTVNDSVLLSTDKVVAYLEKVLIAMALSIEAKTSFITFWLPYLLKHDYVALRFLPQDDYGKTARLMVSPTPDVVTRVFMLFRGVTQAESAAWASATERVDLDAAYWVKTVGIDERATRDKQLFRVLEWGGMEVV